MLHRKYQSLEQDQILQQLLTEADSVETSQHSMLKQPETAEDMLFGVPPSEDRQQLMTTTHDDVFDSLFESPQDTRDETLVVSCQHTNRPNQVDSQLLKCLRVVEGTITTSNFYTMYWTQFWESIARMMGGKYEW